MYTVYRDRASNYDVTRVTVQREGPRPVSTHSLSGDPNKYRVVCNVGVRRTQTVCHIAIARGDQQQDLSRYALESIAGSLTWLSEVVSQGQLRRVEIYLTIVRYSDGEVVAK